MLPLLLLAHCKDFFAVHNLFGIEWWWSNPAGTLCGSGVLVFSGLAIYGRVGRFVSFLVGAQSPAVEKGVQGFLLPAPRQAAEALAARPGVNPARLSLRQCAR